jgi:hypothetical protein
MAAAVAGAVVVAVVPVWLARNDERHAAISPLAQ